MANNHKTLTINLIYAVLSLLVSVMLIFQFFQHVVPAQSYPQPVAGVLSFYDISKARDIDFIYAVLLLSPILFLFFRQTAKGMILIFQRLALYNTELPIKSHILSIPALAGSILSLTVTTASYYLLSFIFHEQSYLLSALLAGALAILLRNSVYFKFQPKKFNFQLVIFILSLLTLTALSILIGKIFRLDASIFSNKLTILFTAVVLTQVAIQLQDYQRKMYPYILAITLPLFLAVIPLIGNFSTNPADFTYVNQLRVTYWLEFIIVSAGVIHYFFLLKASQPDLKSLPLYPVAIFLAYLSSNSFAGWGITPDDFHFGEMVTPWAMYAKFNLVPYLDFMPVRGLINYTFAGISAALYNSTLSGLLYAHAIGTAVFFAVFFWVMRKALPIGIILLLSLFLPRADGLYEGEFFAILLIVFAFISLRKSPSQMIFLRIIVAGLILILYMPGQGILAMIAVTTILVIFIIQRKVLRNYFSVKQNSLPLLGIIIILAAITYPLLIQIITYVREQSLINQIAYGTEYLNSIGLNGTGPYWGEIIRSFGFLVIALLLTLLTYKQFRNKLSLLIPLIIGLTVFSFFYVNRAYVRNDVGVMSRMGIFSTIFALVALPILLDKTRLLSKPIAYILGFVVIGIISAQIGIPSYSFNSAYNQKFSPALVDTASRPDSPYGAFAMFSEEHKGNLNDLITLFDAISAPGDPFLDLTNRGALAYYLNRIPVFETTTFYTSSNLNTQKRILSKIAQYKTLPPVLVDSRNLYFDIFSPSLRVPLIYEFLMEHDKYVLLSYKNNYVLVDKASPYFQSATKFAGITIHDDKIDLLDKLFKTYDINKTPIAWGRGYKVNSSQAQIPFEELVATVQFDSVSDNGLTASYIMAMRKNNLGKNLKYFQIVIPCVGNQLFPARLGYSEAKKVVALNQFVLSCGNNIVPLSYSPKFYLANIESLRLVVSTSLPAGFTFNFLSSTP